MGLLLTAPYIFLRGFKRAYRWRGLYARGLFTGNKNKPDKDIHAFRTFCIY